MESLNKAFISIDKTNEGLNPFYDKIIEMAILKINQIQKKKKILLYEKKNFLFPLTQKKF